MRYKEEDLKIIFDLYRNRKTDEIYSKYPNMTKPALYSLCSRHGIKPDNYFWSEEDVDFLIKNHGIISNKEIAKKLDMRHSPSCVASKAKSLGLENDRYWTKEEKELLKQIYPILPIDDVLSKINRPLDGIRKMAAKLGVESSFNLNTYYTDEQRQFIYDNYNILSDEEISKILNKPLSGIQEQRRKMGLYYFDKTHKGYIDFSKMFRSQLSSWKKESMEKCNYQCIITGSKDFDIHHLHGFNMIVFETIDILKNENKLISDKIDTYSQEELEYFIEVFKGVHSKYPLGICVRKDIHIQFHQIYGSGYNTEQQWDQFIKDNYS